MSEWLTGDRSSRFPACPFSIFSSVWWIGCALTVDTASSATNRTESHDALEVTCDILYGLKRMWWSSGGYRKMGYFPDNREQVNLTGRNCYKIQRLRGWVYDPIFGTEITEMPVSFNYLEWGFIVLECRCLYLWCIFLFFLLSQFKFCYLSWDSWRKLFVLWTCLDTIENKCSLSKVCLRGSRGLCQSLVMIEHIPATNSPANQVHPCLITMILPRRMDSLEQ